MKTALSAIEASLQRQLVRLLVCCLRPGQSVPIGRTQAAAQFFRDIVGDVGLHLQQVRGLPAVLLAPHLRAVRGVDQLDPDHQIVAALRDAPRHNRLHAERPRDLLEIDGLAFVLE